MLKRQPGLIRANLQGMPYRQQAYRTGTRSIQSVLKLFDGLYPVRMGSFAKPASSRLSPLSDEQLTINSPSAHYGPIIKDIAIALSGDILAPLVLLNKGLGLFDQTQMDLEDRKLIGQMQSLSKTLLDSTRCLNNAIKIAFLADQYQSVQIPEALIRVSHQLSLQDKGVALSTDLTVSEIYIQSSVLEELLTALLSNSLRFKHADRPLHIQVKSFRNADRVVIEVRDNGIGIDLTQAGELLFGFRRCFHEGKSGKGLGLFQSRMMARLCGGDLTAKSVPGEGATFSINLPDRLVS